LGVVKHNINGNDYLGVFATSTDKYALVWEGVSKRDRGTIAENLKVKCIGVSIARSDLIGIFSRGNSNGLVLSNMTEDKEVEAIRKSGIDIKIGRLDSDLNTVGNNILANDKVAIVNPDYTRNEMNSIGEILDVEVVGAEAGEFKTVGASNILTNKGIVVNNRCTDAEADRIKEITGFDVVRTTANTGALSIGLSAIANSFGIIIGESTTGFEMARMLEALDIDS
jgi:translation initiation factor 6